jgi:hypothetical protein
MDALRSQDFPLERVELILIGGVAGHFLADFSLFGKIDLEWQHCCGGLNNQPFAAG